MRLKIFLQTIVLHIYMLVVCCHYMHHFLAYLLHSCSLGNTLL